MHTPDQDSPAETEKIDSDHNRSVAWRLQARSARAIRGTGRGCVGVPGAGAGAEEDDDDDDA